LSIPVADAQQLWDDAAKRAADDIAEQSKAAQAERERLAKLAAQRQEVFERELYAAAARGVGSARAMQTAREAVEKAESNLDLSTRAQLGPYRWDPARLGAALTTGMAHLTDLDNERNALEASTL
jgi:hypothetical protein